MKTFIRTILFAFLSLALCATSTWGQSYRSNQSGTSSDTGQLYDTQKRMVLYTARFPESKNMLTQFLQNFAIRINKKEETTEYLEVEFTVSPEHLPKLDSLSNLLGWMESNVMTTVDKTERVSRYHYNLEDEQIKLDSLQAALHRGNLTPELTISLEKGMAQSEAVIRNLKRELKTISQRDSLALVSIKLHDEISVPTTSGKVTFVNMPGVEYGLLFVENPKPGISSKLYQSYSIKYMFTRGKSYFTVGVMKEVNPNPVEGATDKSDSTRYGEMFAFGFGQDFYPKHFGRGKRKFFNLYTGYQLGLAILTQNDEEDSRAMPTANLSMGLELIKTKHILLDNKVSYFLPLHDLNRNLRGILYNASFNFVF
ncbi:hypothetical protein [Rufibacter roseus]|uniref:Uncharacterized protein n=1 Tax=Rufibacter roseus TaxID=1567108 RepID=A0ABW2DIK3_9BACT|nr:hypothetical protein [Rufibacter roseus]